MLFLTTPATVASEEKLLFQTKVDKKTTY